MKNTKEPNRKDILLRAAYDLLKKCHDAHYVLEACATTIFYDEAECDGACLMEDIARELNLEDNTAPLSSSVRRIHCARSHE